MMVQQLSSEKRNICICMDSSLVTTRRNMLERRLHAGQKLCPLLQIHNPIQHQLVRRRIPINRKIRNPHRLESHALRPRRDIRLPFLSRPGCPTADLLEPNLDHGVEENVF